MCGLFCFVSKDEVSEDVINSSLEILKNRGPDARGVSKYRLGNYNVVLGHTRLSILDLSEKANQPFSEDGFHLVFNGEIYNHLELRKKFLSNDNFQTTSDTETLIKLFKKFDHSKFMHELRGMFSFVILNEHSHEIGVFRDRAGEKPLYISSTENFLSFSSDLRVNRLMKGFDSNISRESVGKFLRYGYVPCPDTIYESSFKLSPGSKIKFNLKNLKLKKITNIKEFEESRNCNISNWWNMPEIANERLSHEDAKSQLTKTLEDSVKMQQISDVPIGTFLSGGIDSSLITSFVAQNASDVKCFNIGFEFSKFDESVYAKKISDHLGLKMENLTCSKELALNEIQNIHLAYDEPFADSSQIPTMLISRLASEQVKVILTGDCGDEIFGGYNRYLLGKKYAKLISSIPSFGKDLIYGLSKSNVSWVFDKVAPNFKSKFEKGARKIKGIESDFDFYNSMVSEWKDEDKIFQDTLPGNKTIDQTFQNQDDLDIIDKMMISDFKTYMTDDILCKVDRASMHYSLETRVPFLDLDVIELSRKIKQNDKISEKGETKKILREILKEFVPTPLFDRPKQGFGVPVSIWLKDELKDWAHDHLSKETNMKHNFFNQEVIEKTFNDHIAGKSNNEYKLWYLIQFNQWYLNNHESK
tara:strand:+ start:9280 stop:11211 length:1932 start_codon:yes stop_codon:yes gene_type:complete